MSRTLATLSLVLLMIPSALAQPAAVPVLVGGEAEFDACGGTGRVRGLDPKGDAFLSVRAGPSSQARETDRLAEGDEVALCDRRGRWLGVVYGRGSCGVATPIERREPYRGPCRSGWVFESFVRLDAG